MEPILLLIILSCAILVLFAFLRIAESAFIRITSEFLDEIESPTPSDYRTDAFLDKPAPVLVSFSVLKYTLLTLLSIAVFISIQICLPASSVFIRSIITTFVVWILFWIFGELIPALWGKCNERKTFQASFFIIVPVISLIVQFKKVLGFSFARYENRIARKDMISISDISDAIENSEVEDEEIMEKQLIQGIVKFGDLEVKEIMRARIDVVSICTDNPFEVVIDKMLEAGYSRYPAYGESLDDIKGVVYIKDLLPALRNGEKAYNWQKHIRQAMFVPENMKISQLLVDFQTHKMHMAVVVDEYGGTSGIASLEDVLEEIVGEINDEHDADSDQILARQIAENTFVFDAKIPIHDLTRIAGIDSDLFDKFEGEVETLGGIILSICGNFPSKNQNITYKNIEFTVLSMSKHRIGNVKVKINESNQES
ncbi:MAG: transporter associated domain-containing protein [Bacteroidales bacterium]|jgi:gliding motility-associated protein GldE|nr:transporter associated domain-containing protein [Bacteroidales bacterium]HPB02431.1 transporter associated domain-containing protein [Bacteroidales bacterium]